MAQEHFHVYSDHKSGCPETVQEGVFRRLYQAQARIQRLADQDILSNLAAVKGLNFSRLAIYQSGHLGSGYLDVTVTVDDEVFDHKIHRLARCEEEVCRADIA